MTTNVPKEKKWMSDMVTEDRVNHVADTVAARQIDFDIDSRFEVTQIQSLASSHSLYMDDQSPFWQDNNIV